MSGGCYTEEKVVRDPWANYRELAERTNPTRSRKADRRTQWGVAMATFNTKDHRAKAGDALKAARQRLPESELHIAGGPEFSTLYYGRYTDPSDELAKRDLMRIRLTELDGARPYASAVITPIVGTGNDGLGTDSDFDLHRHPGAYTLQIGYYDDAFGPDFRKAAEKAVAVLRGEGHEAYFYHGPNRSLITVSLFSEEDVLSDLGENRSGNKVVGFRYSPRVKALQERFPYNLGNGLTLVEKRAGQANRDQPSFIVQVPKEP